MHSFFGYENMDLEKNIVISTATNVRNILSNKNEINCVTVKESIEIVSNLMMISTHVENVLPLANAINNLQLIVSSQNSCLDTDGLIELYNLCKEVIFVCLFMVNSFFLFMFLKIERLCLAKIFLKISIMIYIEFN